MDFQNIITVFKYAQEGILLCDRNGNILTFNPSYGDFIGYSIDEVKGKAISKIRPGARLPEVIKTGKPIKGYLREENGEKYFVNIYPIRENEKVVGAVSIVIFLKGAKLLKEQLEELEEKEKNLQVRMKRLNGTKYSFKDIVGDSDVSKKIKEMACKVSASDSSVFLMGESGSGKELYAQSIHNMSKRREQPFIAINCATLNDSLLESELFGYEEGAFTGAKKGGKLGLFEIASGGSIFLDEISEMEMGLQVKLLRVLQEGVLRRVGGTKDIEIDVRVISACNVDIEEYIRDNKFRRDLFYRLAIVPIKIPPLRERREDIPPLIEEQLKHLAIQNKRDYTLSKSAFHRLMTYSYPGNIRELRNILEFASLMTVSGIIENEDLPVPLQYEDLSQEGKTVKSLSEISREAEKNYIQSLLEIKGHSLESKREIAKELGVSLATLYNKLK